VAGRPEVGVLIVPSLDAREAVSLAARAEAAGFAYVWVADERFFRDPFQLLALIARATSSAQIGPCVVDPYTRRPIQMAVAIATLDEISGGRALLGIGAGASGFRQLDIRRDPPPARAVGAAVDWVRRYLAERSHATEDPGLDFAPPRERVPIFVAAEGPRMLSLAGAAADGAILQAKVSTQLLAPAKQAVFDAAGGKQRRRPSIVARVDVSVATDLGAARAALKPRVARRLIAAAPEFTVFRTAHLDVPSALADAVVGIGYTNDAHQLAELGRGIPDEWVDHFCIAASPDDIGERLDRLAEQGVDQILVRPVPAQGESAAHILDAVAAWSG